MKTEINKIWLFLKENKKLQRMLWVLGLVLFFVLFSTYKKNKPCKMYYNAGIAYFYAGDYESAEEHFQYALWEKHTKKMECKIRINKALSITTPITPESVTPDNLDEQIARLEEARDILVENDCAHKDDSNGHNKKAQKLKEEIDEYIEFLKEQNPEPEEEENNGGKSENEDPNTQEEEKKREEEEKRRQREEQNQLKEKFEQIEREGQDERNNNLELYEEWNSESSSFYSGKSW